MKRVLSICALLILFFIAAPAVHPSADFFSPGNPCFAERTTYYSSPIYSQVIGVDEIICWSGRSFTGQTSPYATYEYLGQCCTNCVNGACGIEP